MPPIALTTALARGCTLGARVPAQLQTERQRHRAAVQAGPFHIEPKPRALRCGLRHRAHHAHHFNVYALQRVGQGLRLVVQRTQAGEREAQTHAGDAQERYAALTQSLNSYAFNSFLRNEYAGKQHN